MYPLREIHRWCVRSRRDRTRAVGLIDDQQSCVYGSSVATQTIYVELVDEGVDVWRPVDATVEHNGTFRLPDHAPEGEAWRFLPGSVVRCERRLLSDRAGECRVPRRSSRAS